MSMNAVLTDFTDGLMTITLNRPDAFNSINQELRTELRDAFVRATEPDVRAVLLKGSAKAFCAGQDLKEHITDIQTGNGMDKVVTEYNPMVDALVAIDAPVVAAIEGATAGAGWSLALHCDFRIAGPKASFKAAFPSISLAPDCGMSAILARIVGDAKAREILMLDPKITADEAKELGLVTTVVDNPVEAAEDMARKLASGPTLAYREIKALLRREMGKQVSDAAEAEAGAQARLAQSADHHEAVSAFVEKRTPTFRGK
ncbi:enoyl-CoA hydratase/isomerase family protein [Corynebacterium sp. H113]|uniref:enoyl-CoA hydratase/isomerase family protein n=1 Tax=Corynebacterium sp. H113 TaxID=3133419 RepID=UPI0030B674C8